MRDLTIDDATQFTRPVLWEGAPARLTMSRVAVGRWSVGVIEVGGWRDDRWLVSGSEPKWGMHRVHPFPTAQAALDAAMATPQITEAP